METNLNEKVINLRKVINDYSIVSKKALNDLEKIGDLDYQGRICSMILKRLNANSRSIGCILTEFIEDENSDVEYSVGLLLRNCISDIITMCYLNWLGANQKLSYNEMEESVRSIFGDQISRTATPFKHLDKSIYEKLQDQICEKYPTFFRKNEDGILEPLFKETNVSTQFMAVKSREEFKDHFPNIFDRWIWYSKYEHIGAITYDISKIPFEDRLGMLTVSIHDIILTIRMIMLNQKDRLKDYEEIDGKMKIIADSFAKRKLIK